MKTESLENQVQSLATFIQENCEGYPNANEGAIDCAITIIQDLQSEKSGKKAKVIKTENHEVVVMRRSDDENGEHVQVTMLGFEGFSAEMKMGFKDDEEQADACFDKFSKEQAESIIDNVFGMTSDPDKSENNAS